MRIKYSCFSDIGKTRDINQDTIFCRQKEETGLFAVADGMGGHTDGELASMEVADELIKWWNVNVMEKEPSDFMQLVRSLEEAVQTANSFIYQKYNNGVICGCTVVALLIYRRNYALISAGDSRVYILRGFSNVSQISHDDVWEAQASVRAQFSPEEIAHHENKGKLMNAVGVYEQASLHITTDDVKKADTFLLCSDGIYKMCTEDQIKKWMKAYRHDPEDISLLPGVKEEIYARGATDNMSVVFVKITAK